MSRRRRRRRVGVEQAQARPRVVASEPAFVVVMEARRVERLAYTRSQAAQALGVSRSTFNRRVLPLVEMVEMPWGGRLVPVDELKRVLRERRRQAKGGTPPRPRGRPTGVSNEVVRRIRTEHAAGKSLSQIARDLDADRVPTAHGGVRWWPSTVRGVLARSAALDG